MAKQLDLTMVPVRNAASTPGAGIAPPIQINKRPARAKNTKMQGVRYITAEGLIFADPKYTIQTLLEYEKSYYGAGLIIRLVNLIFTGNLLITVKDPNEREDPVLTKEVRAMANKAGLYMEGRTVLKDICWKGAYLASPEWQWVENTYTLTDLIRLPPESFVEPAPGTMDTYSELLQGITIDDSGKPHYWQTVEGVSTEITNIVCITNPDVQTLGGEALFRPLLLFMAYLKHAWEAVVRTIHRAGSPVLFMEVTDGDEDDFDYAQKVLEDWGATTAFQIPSKMKPINPGIQEPRTPIEAIDMLTKLLVDFFSPAAFVQNQQATLSSSDSGSDRNLQAFILGMRSWIEDGLEVLLQPYLDANGYAEKGYTLEVTIPAADIDRTNTYLQIVGTSEIKDLLSLSEGRAIVRKALGSNADLVPELSDEEVLAMEEKRTARQTAAMNPLLGGFVGNAVRFYNAIDKKK